MRKILLSLMFLFVFSTYTFANCYISCAAICRYTCEFEFTGSCPDSQRDAAIRNCCNGAFANTPGINDVPCTVSGSQV